MKTWIVLGALIIGLAAVAVRPPRTEVVVRERRVEVPVRIEVPVEVPKVVERTRVESQVSEKPARPLRTSPVPSGSVLAQERMLFLFDRELDLRAEQHQFMCDVLKDREKEIEAYNREVVVSGVFRPNEYDRRIKAIQAASYARMGQILETSQRPRFERLLAEGRLGDAVMFEILPTLKVVQD